MRHVHVVLEQEQGQVNPGWENKWDGNHTSQGPKSNLQQKGFLAAHPRPPQALHPRAPNPSALGVTAGVLVREVHRHRVFAVELQAREELLDHMGILSGQVMSFFWVLINVKEPEGLGWWVW